MLTLMGVTRLRRYSRDQVSLRTENALLICLRKLYDRRLEVRRRIQWVSTERICSYCCTFRNGDMSGAAARSSKLARSSYQTNFSDPRILVRSFRAQLGVSSAFTMPAPTPVVIQPGDAELLNVEAPFARDFWISLGFDYTAIDVDGSPKTIPLDLNFDSIPETLRKKFDLVTNFGTTDISATDSMPSKQSTTWPRPAEL